MRLLSFHSECSISFPEELRRLLGIDLQIQQFLDAAADGFFRQAAAQALHERRIRGHETSLPSACLGYSLAFELLESSLHRIGVDGEVEGCFPDGRQPVTRCQISPGDLAVDLLFDLQVDRSALVKQVDPPFAILP